MKQNSNISENTKRLVILGAGESGAGTAVLAKQQGFDVFVSDFGTIKDKYKDLLNKHQLEWEEKQHSADKILSATEVVKSPGIPDTVDIVKQVLVNNIPVISEIEFASRYTDAKTICITGSNGKTTTTLLLFHMLQKAGLNIGLAGNVGQSFALQVAENNFDYYVIELSSFQLDGMFDFKADIAILMNITPDHLDRYDYNFQNYIDSKFRVIQNQTAEDYFIYCADDEIINKEFEKREIKAQQLPFSVKKTLENGAYKENNELIIIINLTKYIQMSIFDLSMKGTHSTYNSMAAGIAGSVLNLRKEVIRESLKDFKGVEHRLEQVIKIHGMQFINDSKATNVNSTWFALETVPRNIIWIVGGVDKGNDYSALTELVKSKVKAIVCLGKDNSKIHKAFDGIVTDIIDTESMNEAVRTAYYLGSNDDNILLSPSCASFDLFDNYEDRGRKFKMAVRSL